MNYCALYGFYDVLCTCPDGDVLSMHKMYCSMHMPIGGKVSMPTGGCSVCMLTFIVNSKLRDAEQDFVPYMAKVILTHIPVECGVVDPYVDRFLNGSN